MARWFWGAPQPKVAGLCLPPEPCFPSNSHSQAGNGFLVQPAWFSQQQKLPGSCWEALQLCSPPHFSVQFLQSSIQPKLGLTWPCTMLLGVFLPFTSNKENTQAASPVPFCVIVQNAAVTPTGFLLGFTQLWAPGALNKGIYAWTWQWQAFLLA